MAKNIISFWRDTSPFSQWYQHVFTAHSIVIPVLDEASFTCAEQYMMAEKAILFGDEKTCEAIMSTKDPSEQKRLGRMIKNYDENIWNEWRERIVYAGNMAKFTSDENMRKILLSTGNKILVEASPYDRIWGAGISEDDPRINDPKRWLGLNLLGKILMQVRENIKKE